MIVHDAPFVERYRNIFRSSRNLDHMCRVIATNFPQTEFAGYQSAAEQGEWLLPQAEEWMAKHIRDFRRGFELAGIELERRVES